jgi:hypothetical protein
MKSHILLLLAVGVLLPPLAHAGAQQTRPRPAARQPAATPERGAGAASVTLVYEREVFSYEGVGRRDPFVPLADDALGPRFDQLALQGIIYSPERGRSVALLADASGRVHRVREGDVLGTIRVLEISQLRVVMAVETFGTIRREMLELQRRGEAQR